MCFGVLGSTCLGDPQWKRIICHPVYSAIGLAVAAIGARNAGDWRVFRKSNWRTPHEDPLFELENWETIRLSPETMWIAPDEVTFKFHCLSQTHIFSRGLVPGLFHQVPFSQNASAVFWFPEKIRIPGR